MGCSTMRHRDANADNVYEVIVRVTDGGTPGLIYEKALAVTVLNVNDPPQLVVNKGITTSRGPRRRLIAANCA